MKKECFYFTIMLLCIVFISFVNWYNYYRAEKYEELLKFYIEKIK